jgi:hypothetical protein
MVRQWAVHRTNRRHVCTCRGCFRLRAIGPVNRIPVDARLDARLVPLDVVLQGVRRAVMGVEVTLREKG